MPNGSDRRTHKLRRAEIVSLSAALTVFAIVAVLGLVVWLRSSAGPDSEVVQRLPTVAVARTAVSELSPVVTAPAQLTAVPPIPQSQTAVATSLDPVDLIPDWPEERPFSLLLLGLDRRPGETGGRTDAMILVHVEPASRSATLISIPRDLCVSGCQSDPYRINSVWQREGPEVLRRRVGDLIGVQVDYWLTLDFPGFRRLVDFFGGVEVQVDETIYDATFPNATDSGFDPFYAEAGLNHFSGEEALRYVRTRHQDGAFARDQRQQRLLLALKQQVLSPRTLVQSPAFLRELSEAFETNLPFELVPSIAKLAMRIGSERVVSGAIQPDSGLVRAVIAESGAYVLQPNVPLIQAFAADLMRQSDALPPPAPEVPAIRLADRQHLEP